MRRRPIKKRAGEVKEPSREEIKGIALGVLGLENYRRLTVRELFSAINERYKHEAEKDKADWERARVITFMVLDTSQARQADKRKVKKQFAFPWDKPDGAIGESSLTKQDMERIKESMKKLDK